MDGARKNDGEDVRKLEEVAHDLHDRAERKEEEARHALEEARELEKEGEQVEGVIREIEDRDHGGGDRPDQSGFAITLSVNTQRLEMEVRPDECLAKVRARALQQTNNVARPPEDWDIKTEQDTVLDVQLTVEQAGIKAGALLFVSLRAGSAGA